MRIIRGRNIGYAATFLCQRKRPLVNRYAIQCQLTYQFSCDSLRSETGLSLLIHYLHTLWVYVQGCKANAGGKLMPFVMGEDRIGGIRLSLCGGREDWEKVVEGVARNLEFLKTHVHTFV